MELYAQLQQEHKALKSFIDQVVDTNGNLAIRQELFNNFRKRFRDYVDDPTTQTKQDELVQTDDHVEVKDKRNEVIRLIERLEHTSWNTETWLRYACDLRNATHNYLNTREQRFFQMQEQ